MYNRHLPVNKGNATPSLTETRTHKFFCLADKDQIVALRRSLKIQLQEAGLGRKKVCLNGRADTKEVTTTLEDSYPKFKERGGFEILRRGPNPSELTLKELGHDSHMHTSDPEILKGCA